VQALPWNQHRSHLPPSCVSDTMPPKRQRTSAYSSIKSRKKQRQTSPVDEDQFWAIKDIINETQTHYLIDWEGIDPKTGQPYLPDWVRQNFYSQLCFYTLSLVRKRCQIYVLMILTATKELCQSRSGRRLGTKESADYLGSTKCSRFTLGGFAPDFKITGGRFSIAIDQIRKYRHHIGFGLKLRLIKSLCFAQESTTCKTCKTGLGKGLDIVVVGGCASSTNSRKARLRT
jgi:hypothetical protein